VRSTTSSGTASHQQQCFLQAQAKQEKRPPTLDELLDARDYVGAITLLNFKRQGNRNDAKLVEWLAYAHYHHGEHDKVCSRTLSMAPAQEAQK
jgi:hypothetical protein